MGADNRPTCAYELVDVVLRQSSNGIPLTPKERCVLACLASHINNEEAKRGVYVCWPSWVTLQALLTCKENIIKSAINSLIKKGVITKRTRGKFKADGHESGGRNSNKYTINIAVLLSPPDTKPSENGQLGDLSKPSENDTPNRRDYDPKPSENDTPNRRDSTTNKKIDQNTDPKNHETKTLSARKRSGENKHKHADPFFSKINWLSKGDNAVEDFKLYVAICKWGPDRKRFIETYGAKYCAYLRGKFNRKNPPHSAGEVLNGISYDFDFDTSMDLFNKFLEAYPIKCDDTYMAWIHWIKNVYMEEQAFEAIDRLAYLKDNEWLCCEPEFIPKPSYFLRDRMWL